MYIRDFTDLQAARITEIEELRPEQWRELNTRQRLSVLQRCEDAIASFEKRPPAMVSEISYLDENLQKDKGSKAEFHSTENTISISYEDLQNNNPYAVFDKLVHEARHAYIDHAISTPNFHGSSESMELKEWAEANESYVTPQPGNKESYELYKRNFIEKICGDAQTSLAKALKDEHEKQRADEQLKKERVDIEAQKSLQSDGSKDITKVSMLDKSGEEVRIPRGRIIARWQELQGEKQVSPDIQNSQKQKDDRDKERDR